MITETLADELEQRFGWQVIPTLTHTLTLTLTHTLTHTLARTRTRE